jgi:DNA-binding response OmpR family regulator
MTTPTVLVCDDTPAKRYVLASWLRRSGYDVVECDTAAAALELLSRESIDLAVLDIHLPDGNGLDITRALRADPVLASTPVVHVSAVAMETSDKVTALNQGADAYLVDPIEPEELLSTVRALLRSSGARREAELLAIRLSRLNRAVVRLNVAASAARLAEATAKAASEVVSGAAAAQVVDADGTAWRTIVTPAEPDLLTSSVAVAVTGEDDRADWTDQLPTVAGGWATWPIRIDRELVGEVAVPTSGSDEDQGQIDVLLQRLAQAAGGAARNLRALEFEHRTALMLQRSLLPGVLPEPDGLVLAARYQASQQRVEVGGDFFDAFEVGDTCFLVIGDVQGHSLEAAVVMGELRYSLRAYAYDDHGPSAVVERLDRLLHRSRTNLLATVCVLVVSADRRTVDVVCAGHPPPLLIRAGAARHLAAPGPLLGALMGTHPAVSYDLEPGDRLVLFTDGLVERRHEPLDANIEKLAAQVAASSGSSPENIADALFETWGESDDDVALLVIDFRDVAGEHPRDTGRC